MLLKSITHGQTVPQSFQEWPHCFFHSNVPSVPMVSPKATGNNLESTLGGHSVTARVGIEMGNGGGFFLSLSLIAETFFILKSNKVCCKS